MRRFFLLALMVFLSSGVFAQADVLERKVTVNRAKLRMEEALNMLSEAANVQFSYSDDLVPVNMPVRLVVTEKPLGTVLDSLLKDLKLEYKINNNRIILRRISVPITQTIRGRIVDECTGVPVPGAGIQIAGTQPVAGAVSDGEGRFRLKDVPVGRLTLLVASVGYAPQTISNILLGAGKELVLDVRLREAVTAMDEVHIVADRFEDASAENAVVSARSFTVDETKRYAGSIGDPARMASGFAGVTGASDESNALIVRGNSPRGVLWRMEGIEVPNPNHFTSEGSSSGVFSILSANIIDYSEFLTGAFPAQYGNALSAVFDVNLRNGNNEKFEHSFQVGSLGVEASTEGPVRKANGSSYLVNYRYSALSIMSWLGFNLSEAGQYKDYQDVAFKLNYPVGDNGALSAFGVGGRSRSSRETMNQRDNGNSDVGITGINFKKVFNEYTSFGAGVSFSGTGIARDHQIHDLSTGPLRVNENYSKLYSRTTMYIRRKISSAYFLEGGITYSHLNYNFFLENLDPGNPIYQQIINFKESGSASVMQSYMYARQNVSPSLSAVYGFHFIRFDLTSDQSIEPRVGLQWEVSPDKTVAISYGKHSRIENLQYYLARDHQPGGDEVQINKNLGFTRSHHTVIGYRQRLNDSHRLKVEVYYQKLFNAPVQSDPASLYVTLNEDTGFVTDTLINNGVGRNYGFEAGLERTFSNGLYYLFNGTIYQSLFRVGEEKEKNTSYNGSYAIHLLFGKEFALRSGKDRIGINGRVTTAGGRRYVPIDAARSREEGYAVYDWNYAFEPELPAYFRTDLQMVYRRNKPGYGVEWRLNIQNITNYQNAAYYYYDASLQDVVLKRQIGWLPFLSYRIEF